MFTEQQIKAAHSKTKTGADFPKYIQEIKSLGLIRYEYWVTDGHIIYYGENGHVVNSGSRYKPNVIASSTSISQLQHIISIHQQGQTDFLTFCGQVAEAGVEKWVIDIKKMLCTYYDLAGNGMIAEPIPQWDY
jgi:uncharacterized protein YbcV (DUF1398 family)